MTNETCSTAMNGTGGSATSEARSSTPNEPSVGSNGTRWSLAANSGAVLSAFLASACCIGPLLFALLGLGGAGLLLKFEPYRPYFMVLTIAFLGTGFYFTYRKPKVVVEGAACGCKAKKTNRAGRILLWISATMVIGFLAFPYIATFLWG